MYRPEPKVVAPRAEVVGAELHVRRGAILPEICLSCGAHGDGVELRTGPREVGWMPGALVIAWFLNPLLGLLAVALLRKRSAIVYALCLACTRRRLDGFAAYRAIYVAAVLTFLVSLVLMTNDHPVAAVALAFGAGLVGYAFWRRFVERRVLDVLWIHDDGTIAFRNVAPAAMAACAAPELARPA